MQVLFLNPPYFDRFSREQRSPAVTKSGTLYFPKWLSSAAGVAIKEGHDVDLIDAPAKEVGLTYVLDRIEHGNFKAVVCDTSTPSIVNDAGIATAIKEKFPDIKVCLVGRHVSVLPEDSMKLSDSIDAVAVREYEYTVRDWLAAVDSGASMADVEGLVWRDEKGEIIRNAPRPAIENLDELPFVTETYRRFLRIPDYYYGHSLHPLVVFDTSRGCPYHCAFCAYPQTFSGHKMRYRSVGHVADEFEFVAREMPRVRTEMLEDDTFIVHKKRTLELAEELIRRGNKLPYDSNCRADLGLDEALLRKLHQSGARLFCVGFESGDPDVIRGMKKNNNPGRDESYHHNAAEFVRTCKKAGIMVHGCFMVGNLNETRASMDKTLEFALHLNPDTAQFYPIMVYPGTAAYEEAKSRGYLQTEDFTQWLTGTGLHNSVVNLPNVTHQDLVQFCDTARRKFYLRPGYIARKAVQSLRSRDEFVRNYYGFTSLFKHLVHGSQSGKDRETPQPVKT